MKIALLAFHVLMCFIAQAQTADIVAHEILLLNDREIAVETLLLINPRKMSGMHISYPAKGIKQYQIDAKKINFLQYDDLKVRLGLRQDDTPGVYVDGKSYPNKNDFQIDRSFIKRIDYLNGAMRVSTKRKQTKGYALCRGVGVAKQSSKTNFPQPKAISIDKRFIN
jgi:hypothetical protein